MATTHTKFQRKHAGIIKKIEDGTPIDADELIIYLLALNVHVKNDI